MLPQVREQYVHRGLKPMFLRTAAEGDLPELATLLREEFAYQARIAPFIEADSDFDCENYLRSRLNHPSVRLFVAENHTGLLGYIHVRITGTAPSRRTRPRLLPWKRRDSNPIRIRMAGWIEDCYVKPESRRHGVGSALLDKSIGWLVSQNARSIGLAVSAGNPGARAFWEQHGFSPYRIQMSKEVDAR
jgi:GNAT superfamily N-acetyltransferase